ncbi:MAG: hypothetical protein KGI40_03720 [Xanthomonadaceae bacterium]|nr:hypothetical protein [Xanthomonadaceae bacterium]MDE1958177.1 hypothetical protein [Xanthomonadaceae bacterium]MDE2176766.1 hypothetical protein [Xanthomonadaceae bacterium]MDE2246200.1 hypothetical protein [Xanthomonadaceae bacterium]
MARGRHSSRQGNDRQELRRRVALEAARLISEHGIRDYGHAKRRAADRLGVWDEQALPRNAEIEDALREHQRLFQAVSQPQALHARRQGARAAMRFLARFEPRLVGAVLEGTADAHSAICLHVFSDDPDAVPLFLGERGIAAETRFRRVRLDRDRELQALVLLFGADDLGFDLTVLPLDALRQAPLDPIDGRPQSRASLAGVEALLASHDGSPRRGA